MMPSSAPDNRTMVCMWVMSPVVAVARAGQGDETDESR